VGLIGGKWRLPVGKVGEWYVKSRHLQGCSPRLSRLMTDRLAPVSKYWTYRSHTGVYGHSKPSSLLLTDVWLSLLLHWLTRERNWVRARGSVSRRAVNCVGSPFSREQWLCPALLMTCEWLLYMDHMRYVWSWTIHRLSVESVLHVGWVFPYRVYIDSNRRDSQTWVTVYLWQSSRR
jgi:hypothetical protein